MYGKFPTYARAILSGKKPIRKEEALVIPLVSRKFGIRISIAGTVTAKPADRVDADTSIATAAKSTQIKYPSSRANKLRCWKVRL